MFYNTFLENLVTKVHNSPVKNLAKNSFKFIKPYKNSGIVSRVHKNNKHALIMDFVIHVLILNFVCSSVIGKSNECWPYDMDHMEIKKELPFLHSKGKRTSWRETSFLLSIPVKFYDLWVF